MRCLAHKKVVLLGVVNYLNLSTQHYIKNYTSVATLIATYITDPKSLIKNFEFALINIFVVTVNLKFSDDLNMKSLLFQINIVRSIRRA